MMPETVPAPVSARMDCNASSAAICASSSGRSRCKELLWLAVGLARWLRASRSTAKSSVLSAVSCVCSDTTEPGDTAAMRAKHTRSSAPVSV